MGSGRGGLMGVIMVYVPRLIIVFFGYTTAVQQFVRREFQCIFKGSTLYSSVEMSQDRLVTPVSSTSLMRSPTH